MIGQLRVVTATEGMLVFLDRGQGTVRVWKETLELEKGDYVAVVGYRVSDMSVPTLWDHQIVCKHGLCFVHDDILKMQTRPLDTKKGS